MTRTRVIGPQALHTNLLHGTPSTHVASFSRRALEAYADESQPTAEGTERLTPRARTVVCEEVSALDCCLRGTGPFASESYTGRRRWKVAPVRLAEVPAPAHGRRAIGAFSLQCKTEERVSRRSFIRLPLGRGWPDIVVSRVARPTASAAATAGRQLAECRRVSCTARFSGGSTATP